MSVLTMIPHMVPIINNPYGLYIGYTIYSRAKYYP